MTSSVSPVVVVGAREGRCPGVTTQRQARQQKVFQYCVQQQWCLSYSTAGEGVCYCT